MEKLSLEKLQEKTNRDNLVLWEAVNVLRTKVTKLEEMEESIEMLSNDQEEMDLLLKNTKYKISSIENKINIEKQNYITTCIHITAKLINTIATTSRLQACREDLKDSDKWDIIINELDKIEMYSKEIEDHIKRI